MSEAEDSLKARKNIYTCRQCGGHIVTVDRDDGVTPFMLNCRAMEGCKGTMESSFYRVFDQKMAASYEWYRPDETEFAVLKDITQEHVRKGGLLLRPVS